MGRVIDDLGSLGRASKPLGLRVYDAADVPDAAALVNTMIAILDTENDNRARLAMSDGTTWNSVPFTRDGLFPFDWLFDTGTSDADPGTGEIRANHATLSSATYLYINETDAAGISQAASIAQWDDSTSTVKGYISLIDAGDLSKKVRFRITGSITDAGTYQKIPVAYISGATSLTATNVAVETERVGDAGALTVSTYTVGTAPSASPAGQVAYFSNESGGAVLAFSDGTNWRRSTDRAVIS